MERVLKILKQRWGVESSWQVAVIFFQFALTGMSSVYIKKPVFGYFGISWDKNPFIVILAYIFIFFPLYQLLFFIYGNLLGTRTFTMMFLKKMFGRLFPFINKQN